VWKHDPDGLKKRLDRFLAIAAKHRVSVMFCFFDDCAFAGKQPYLGKQDDPVPSVHNSCWTPSPGHARVVDRTCWPDLQAYVQDIIRRFADDRRVLLWDLYNEPGNEKMGNKSLPLVEAAFFWARQAKPSQPLTVGVWSPGGLKKLSHRQIELSDVISFHNYGDVESVRQMIDGLLVHNRPVICTEWMRRTDGSPFKAILPIFKQRRVGCYFWGLVNGKTQTHFPWGSPKGAPEPKMWFHDLLRRDGTPYIRDEVEFIRQVISDETPGSIR
jgi:hypothetical protein